MPMNNSLDVLDWSSIVCTDARKRKYLAFLGTQRMVVGQWRRGRLTAMALGLHTDQDGANSRKYSIGPFYTKNNLNLGKAMLSIDVDVKNSGPFFFKAEEPNRAAEIQ